MTASSSLAPERVMGYDRGGAGRDRGRARRGHPGGGMFNYFQGRVTASLADAETLGHVLLAQLRGERPHSGSAEVTSQAAE